MLSLKRNLEMRYLNIAAPATSQVHNYTSIVMLSNNSFFLSHDVSKDRQKNFFQPWKNCKLLKSKFNLYTSQNQSRKISPRDVLHFNFLFNLKTWHSQRIFLHENFSFVVLCRVVCGDLRIVKIFSRLENKLEWKITWE